MPTIGAGRRVAGRRPAASWSVCGTHVREACRCPRHLRPRPPSPPSAAEPTAEQPTAEPTSAEPTERRADRSTTALVVVLAVAVLLGVLACATAGTPGALIAVGLVAVAVALGSLAGRTHWALVRSRKAAVALAAAGLFLLSAGAGALAPPPGTREAAAERMLPALTAADRPVTQPDIRPGSAVAADASTSAAEVDRSAPRKTPSVAASGPASGPAGVALPQRAATVDREPAPAPLPAPAPVPAPVAVPDTGPAPKAGPVQAPPPAPGPDDAPVPDPLPVPDQVGTVERGAFCSQEGARGVTSKGKAMVCSSGPGDPRPRWRAA